MDAQKRIRELMEERNWTDYRLANEASLSHSTVTNMFNRNNVPTLPTLKAVCKAFGITLAQFFCEGNEPNALIEEKQLLFSKWSMLSDKQKQLLLGLMSTIRKHTDFPLRINVLFFNLFILPSKGRGQVKGVQITFHRLFYVQKCKRKRLQQVIKTAESLYFNNVI